MSITQQLRIAQLRSLHANAALRVSLLLEWIAEAEGTEERTELLSRLGAAAEQQKEFADELAQLTRPLPRGFIVP